MAINEISFPRYVYQQDTQPTDAVNGAIWVDTNASPITTYVYNGSTWTSLTTDVDWLAEQLAQQGINILINATAASATLNDYTKIFVDNFTDADGTSNTIDTGNTTSNFSTDVYVNQTGGGTPVTDAHTYAFNNTGANSGYTGMKFETNKALTFTTITKSSTCTATTGFLLASDGSTVIESAAFVGDVATFNSQLADATTYYAMVYSGGSSYTAHFLNGQTFPQADTNIDWTGGYRLGDGVDAYSVLSVGTENALTNVDTLVQTNVITIPSGITSHQLYCKNSTAGTGSVTYDISADNGSTWDTAQELNNKNPFAATTGTSAIVKLNLDGVGAGNTAEASNYGLIIYT